MIATFIFYWWHRWRHESNFLWRGFYQIHHSPQRLEVITSFYKHPREMIVNSIIGALLVYGPAQEQLRRHYLDMLFGTYENPREWVHTCGFDDEKEQRLFSMLAYRDVHARSKARRS